MVWTRIAKNDGKPRYIKRVNNFVVLTKDKSQATEDEVPEGWEAVTLPSGALRLRKIK